MYAKIQAGVIETDTKLKQQTKELQDQHQGMVMKTTSTLSKLIEFKRHEFTLTDFTQLQDMAEGGEGSWYSEPFYSHPGGCRLKLNVDTNGSGSARGTHISGFYIQLKVIMMAK